MEIWDSKRIKLPSEVEASESELSEDSGGVMLNGMPQDGNARVPIKLDYARGFEHRQRRGELQCCVFQAQITHIY